MNECQAFFSSKTLLDAIEKSPRRQSIWDNLVRKALVFVAGLVDLEAVFVPERKQEQIDHAWNMLFVIIKGAYAAQQCEEAGSGPATTKSADEGSMHHWV